MAIVFSVDDFKIYLLGREFIVRTDHRLWLKEFDYLSTRLARWLII